MIARPAILAGLLLLTGCATPTGSGRSLWLPSTWVGGDAAHRQERAEDRRDAASDALSDAAHGYVVAAGAALAADPTPSQPSQAAASLIGEAREALDRARGLLTPDVLDARETLGRELALAQGRALEAAQARLDELRGETIRQAERLAAAEAAVERATGATAEAQRRYAEAAATVARQRFLLWGSLALIVAGCILIPGLGSLAVFVVRRLRGTLRQIVGAVEEYRTERPDEAQALLDRLSAKMDAANKLLVRQERAKILP